MAFYNFPLRFLTRMRDAEEAGRTVLPLGRAVHRLTDELGTWFGLDAGFLPEGDRADFVILDPERLDESVDAYDKAEAPFFGDLCAWSTATMRPSWPPASAVVSCRVPARGVRPGLRPRSAVGHYLRAGAGAVTAR